MTSSRSMSDEHLKNAIAYHTQKALWHADLAKELEGVERMRRLSKSKRKKPRRK